jgi:hypothetical protein
VADLRRLAKRTESGEARVGAENHEYLITKQRYDLLCAKYLYKVLWSLAVVIIFATLDPKKQVRFP